MPNITKQSRLRVPCHAHKKPSYSHKHGKIHDENKVVAPRVGGEQCDSNGMRLVSPTSIPRVGRTSENVEGFVPLDVSISGVNPRITAAKRTQNGLSSLACARYPCIGIPD